MSPKKELRESAEKELNTLTTLPVTESLKVFSEAMTSPNESIFQLATLMLKKVYFDNESVKTKLTADEGNAIGSVLKSVIDFQTKSWKSLQRIADALAPMYQVTSLPTGLSEIMTWFNNQNVAVSRKFAIYLIEVLCDLQALQDNVLDGNACDNFNQIFMQGLNDADIEVKVSSLKAATQFLNQITNEDIIMKFTGLSDKMLQTLVDALKHDINSKAEASPGKTALETMDIIVERHPKFWKSKIDLLIDIVCEIAKGKMFSNTIREASLELIFSLAKNLPGVPKKSDNFKNKFIPLLFELMLEVDNVDNLQAWEKQVEEDEVDLKDMFYGVRDSFERLSIDLGGKYFMEATAGYIKKLISSENWIEVQAGFTAMGFMAEGCKESYKKNLLEVMNYISTGLTHQHPRVRHSVLTAFGLILKETSPKPQKKYANNILPALALLMSEKEPSLRVKTRACDCICEFVEGLKEDGKESDGTEEIIKPYSDELVKLLSSLFEQSLSLNYPPLQDSTLGAFSVLSDVLAKEFAPYYDVIMPGLKKLFLNLEAKTDEQKKLKRKCIETISFLCSSISETSEKYMNDLKEIAQLFTTYMTTLPEEDPQLETILRGYNHLSISMKEQFIPILEKIFPIFTKYIEADIGIKIEDAALTEYIPEDEDENERGKVGSVVLSMGTSNTKLSLHTFALQNKLLAFEALNDIANNMGTAFFDFTEKLLKIAKEQIGYLFSRKVRKTSIKAVNSCICACKDEEQKGKVLQYIGDDIIREFQHIIKKSMLRDIKMYLKYLTLITANINTKTVFTEKFVSDVFACLGEIAKCVDSKKTEIITKVLSGKVEDEEDILEENFDNFNEISRRVMEVSGNFFKLFKEPLTALVTQHLYDSFLTSWQNAVSRSKFQSDQEILSSICFFCDYMENADLTAFNMVHPMYAQLSGAYKTENEDIIQSVVYGYGIICQRCSKDEFNKVKECVLTGIVTVMQREVNEDNEITYDNSIGALGKYLYYQSPTDENGLNMTMQFIKLLPLKHDLEEGKAVCKEFFTQIKQENKLIVNEQTIPLIKDAIKRISEHNEKEHFLEEEEVALREVMSKLGM